MDEKILANLLEKNRDVAWRMRLLKIKVESSSGFRQPYEHNDIKLAGMLDEVIEIQKEILTILPLLAQQG